MTSRMNDAWNAYVQAQQASNAAWAAYRAASEEAARALEAYSRAVCQGAGRTLALDTERPLNPGNEAVLVGAQQ